jgi:glycosyltransferase involved in cell wall biosynthesis
MSELLFLTDRYPYNNSETFIENEIDILADKFEKVYILPCGLMVNTSTCRKVPDNVVILKPAVSDDIFSTKPNTRKKLAWGFRHLLVWYLSCLFSSYFYNEVFELIKNHQFNFKRLMMIFRTLAPALRNKRHFKKLLKHEKLSNVYVYSYWLEPTILFVKDIVKKCTIIKEVCRTHGGDLYSERNSQNYLPYQKKIIASIDNLFFISLDGKNYLENKYPQFSNKYTISRLGTKDYCTCIAQQNLKQFVIVSCSHIVPLKRIDRIIEGLNFICLNFKSEKKIRWIHFGAGQDKKEIEEYAKKMLEGKIDYCFAGEIQNKQLMQYYKDNYVDLFINVSTSEGVPVSIMEAISFGIPVVATNVGGTAEIVYDTKNGILLNENFTDEEFAEAVCCFINDKIEVKDYRKQSRLIWEMNCNSTSNYENFCNNLLS